DLVGAAVVPDIGDVTVALVMDGRLIGAAPLQIIIADQFHVGGFGRRPDHLLLRPGAATGGECNRNQRDTKSAARHPVPPPHRYRPILRWLTFYLSMILPENRSPLFRIMLED